MDPLYLQRLMENQGRVCALSGLPFKAGNQRDDTYLYSPSLDKIDPFGRYEPGNVRFVINALNALKGRGTDEDVLIICKAVVEKQR